MRDRFGLYAADLLTMRLFLAIPLPEPVATRLAEVALRLKVGRPLPEENLHLTIAFLGEQREPALEELHCELERLHQPALPVTFGPLGTFGDSPGTVHAEVQLSPGLKALHRSVMGAVRGAGITLERRRFRPHVTIARLPRHPAPGDHAEVARFLGVHAATPLPDFTADRLILYRSWLRPEGSLYEDLADYPLG
ncbi:RNA 2',3'-cyclic phosphodiesterase [Frigidibacter sp. RF13]|uniref:RNA 2',3'-cyclic phosphodiesterase n=1 Tax=Frigidibacter sp. RF13 TaxID=2997340 RepID=UPI0022711C7E|nr:RNA 2',3'-cyclic phosphodiesterase [Frigidibacter sp. RF13]MCY1128166.1 RNA 2',3'-cyclic phosphodiesterase [Frigidibacter sp. RF13]